MGLPSSWRRRRSRGRGRFVALLALASCLVSLALPSAIAVAWEHDHSSSGVPYRPNGYAEIASRFGDHCGSAADDARSWWPNARGSGVGGYVYYNPYIARNVAHNVLGHVKWVAKTNAINYSIFGYSCRQVRGSTAWSMHSYGAAIDTNVSKNPMGQSYWNGVGVDGKNYYQYLPGVYQNHNFFWGLYFGNRPDPMHFQYATGT